MATPIWPPSLPIDPLLDGYGETASTPKVTVGPDNGPPIQRPKTTLRMTNIQVTYDMDDDQLQTFEDFVYYDLGKGSLEFLIPHPRKQVQVRARIVSEEPYSFVKKSPKRWAVSTTLLVIL